MSILNIAQVTVGNVGNAPTQYNIATNDNFSTVTNPGYLSAAQNMPYTFTGKDYAWVTTYDSGAQPMQIVVSGSVVSLASYGISETILQGDDADGLYVSQYQPNAWSLMLAQNITTTADPIFDGLSLTSLSGFSNAATAVATVSTSDGTIGYVTPSATVPLYLANTLSGAPQWSTVSASGISGVLPIVNGGTNSSTTLSNGYL